MSKSLLLSRKFLPLFLTQTTAIILDNIYRNAFILMIFYHFGSSELGDVSSITKQNYSILSAALIVFPFIIFSSIAGALCDKKSKSQLAKVIKGCEIIIIMFGCYAMYIKNINLIFFTLFLLGTHSTFLAPLKLSLIPEYLKENQFLTANAFIEIGTFSSILIGEIFANIFFISQYHGIFILIIFMLTISISGFVASLFLPPTEAKNPKLKINFNIFKGSSDIIRKTRQNKTIYLCILGISWFWLVSGIIINEIPILIKNSVNALPGVLTFSLVTFGVGIASGSILCNKLLRNRIEATYVPLAAFGIAITLYDLASIIHTFTPSSSPISVISFLSYLKHWHIVLDFYLIGLLGGLYHVPLYTIMIHESEERERARVIACHNIIATAFMISGSILNFALSYMFSGNSAYTLAFVSAIFAWISIYISQIMPYGILQMLFRLVFQSCYRAKITGMENYFDAKDDRLVIIANHTSWLDALILASFLPDKLTFALSTTMSEHWLIKFFIKLNKVYLIDPSQPMGMRGLIEAVKNGEKVVIFPEGRLTETGSIMKIIEAPAIIANQAKAKILPIHISGIKNSIFTRMKASNYLSQWPKLQIHIAKKESFKPKKDADNREKRKQASDFIYRLMTEINYNSNKLSTPLFESLLLASKSHGKKTKICTDINRNPLSYQQLIMKSFALRLGLLRNLGSNDKNVGLLLPTAAPTVVSFFSLQSLALVPVMLNYTHGSSQLTSCCQTAAITRVISSRKFVSLAKLEPSIEALLKAGIHVFYLEDIASNITSLQKILSYVASWAPRTYYSLIKKQIKANDTAVILFTSGSEGKAKGVALSHDNIQANISQITSVIDLNKDDTIFNMLPLFHSFGLMGGFLLPTLCGIKMFLYPNPLHYRIINELIYSTNSTILFGTDYSLNLYASNANPYDFYSLRYVLAGAEKLQASTFKLWSEKFGIRVLEAYGLTEASPGVALNTPMHYKGSSVGRLLPKIDFRLEKIEGVDKGGRLFIKGPNIMQGYIKSSAPGVINPIKDRWHDTGDIAYVDEDGFLFIEGRLKRFAKIAGEMISLTAVENAIFKSFKDFQHAILTLPCPKRGQELALCTEDSSINKTTIQKEFSKRGISELWIPKKIVNIEIPKFPTGKTNYVSLQEKFDKLNKNSTSKKKHAPAKKNKTDKQK